MKTINIFTFALILAVSTLSTSAYTEIQCDTDPVFSANSCSQCFTGGDKGEGSHLGELKDEWINNSTSDKILYKVEQEMPKMINLSPSLVKWVQNPSSEDFWEYPKDLDLIYDNEDEGYILTKGERVNWLQSRKGFTYTLEKNKEVEGKNIGLLTYLITTHNISDNGDINTDADEHRECVLFKSGKKVEDDTVIPSKVETKDPEKKLPNSGPEHYILLILFSIIIGFIIMKTRKII